MFERYTEKARQAIFFARYEASVEASPYIETTHLLLGILRANQDLKAIFGDPDAIKQELSAGSGGPPTSTSTDLPLSHGCRQVLSRAAEEADHAKQSSITTLHLLAGLLQTEPYDPAHTTITRRGITLESIRARLADASEPAADHPGSDADALKFLPSDRQSAVMEIAHLLGAEVSVEIVIKTPGGERSYRFS